MKKADVKIGGIYLAKISGSVVPVKLVSESPHGGWIGRSEKTGREVRIKTAAKLRREWKGGGAKVERVVVVEPERTPDSELDQSELEDQPEEVAKNAMLAGWEEQKWVSNPWHAM